MAQGGKSRPENVAGPYEGPPRLSTWGCPVPGPRSHWRPMAPSIQL